MSKEKLAYPFYHTCTYTLEEANNFRSVFLNLFSTAFKRQKSLTFNKSYYFNNVECLVVDKAFIFIWSWEIDVSYLVYLDRVLKNAMVIFTKKLLIYMGFFAFKLKLKIFLETYLYTYVDESSKHRHPCRSTKTNMTFIFRP